MGQDIVEQIIHEVPQDFHGSGSLSPLVLRRIAELHRLVGAKVSAETGCGLTTLILSHLSERHTSFTVDFGDSLPKTRENHLFNAASTRFIINPTQVSLPVHSFTEPLDFAILDGPHAYPFPDLEYFFFYPHVRQGGILVIDDVHIPTIGNLREFLRDDEMWEHLGDVETTAFFRRTTAPLLHPHGDGWPSQRYNRRHFQYPQALEALYGQGWYQAEFGSEKQQKRAMSGIDAGAGEEERSLLQGKFATAQAELADTQAELAATKEQLRHLRSRVDALQNSTSWRATAPLRSVKTMLGGGRRNE